MTKSRKNLILIMLTALLTFSIGFFALWSHTAKADSTPVDTAYTEYDLIESSNNWGFTPGATIQSADDFSKDNMVLGFELQSLGLKYEDLMSVQTDKWDNYGALGKHSIWMNDAFNFTFTIYRGNSDATTSTAIAKINININYNEIDGSLCLSKAISLEKLVPRLEEEIFLSGFENYDKTLIEEMIDMYPGYTEEELEEILFSVGGLSAGYLKKGGLFNLGKEEYKGNVCIKTPSVSAKYFVRFDYDFWVNNKDRKLYKDQDHDKNYTHYSPERPADSNAVSVMDILTSLNDSGTLDDTFEGDSQETANDFITNTERKEVTVRFLKDIEGTPFAEMHETTVTVPVVNDEVSIIDLYVALGVSNVNAINGNSITNSLVKDANGIYTAYYKPSVWLRSYTSGDQYLDSYVDTNLSYYDYYKRYVDDDVITQDIVSYQWSQLVVAYPQLNYYTEKQVYGFFGMVMIPDHIDLNSLWMDAFGIGKTQSGMITFAQSKYNFSDAENALAKYYVLMDKYDYGWLKSFEATFNAAFLDGKLDANVYLYTCDGKDHRVVISEGGSEQGGAINSDVGGLAGKIKDFFTRTNETLTELGTEIGTNKTVLIILLIVAVIVIVLIKLWPIIAKNFRRRK